MNGTLLPLLCGVLADDAAAIELLRALGAAGCDFGRLLLLSRLECDAGAAGVDGARFVALGDHGGAAVRGIFGADEPAPDAAETRRRLRPLRRLQRHNPEAYWSLVDRHVHAGRAVVLFDPPASHAIDNAVTGLFLAHAVHRVELVDLAAD